MADRMCLTLLCTFRKGGLHVELARHFIIISLSLTKISTQMQWITHNHLFTNNVNYFIWYMYMLVAYVICVFIHPISILLGDNTCNTCNTSRPRQMAVALQTFSLNFFFVFWFEFHWNLFPMAQLTICQPWSEAATSHYIRHICVTRMPDAPTRILLLCCVRRTFSGYSQWFVNQWSLMAWRLIRTKPVFSSIPIYIKSSKTFPRTRQLSIMEVFYFQQICISLEMKTASWYG